MVFLDHACENRTSTGASFRLQGKGDGTGGCKLQNRSPMTTNHRQASLSLPVASRKTIANAQGPTHFPTSRHLLCFLGFRPEVGPGIHTSDRSSPRGILLILRVGSPAMSLIRSRGGLGLSGGSTVAGLHWTPARRCKQAHRPAQERIWR